jgi:hypothetical protein
LGQSPGLQEIGKLVISLVILECEAMYIRKGGNENRRRLLLNSPDPGIRNTASNIDPEAYNDDWCRFVLYQLVSNCKSPSDLLANNVVFITFNYDISLEYKLYNGLYSIEYFLADHIVDDFFDANRVLHVYGTIRDLPTPSNFNMPELEAIPLGVNPRSNPDQYMKCKHLLDIAYQASQNLRVISDDKGLDDDVIKQASDAVKKAQVVYILGYGFDENNSNLLELSTTLKAQMGSTIRVFFTNFEDRNSVNKKASRLFTGDPKSFLPPQLIYDNYHHFGPIRPLGETIGYYEKSTRNVYEALERDFDW